MISLRMTVVAVAGSLLSVQGALAQVDESAKKALEASNDALAKLQSVEFTARRYGEGQIKLIDFTADVKIVRSANDRNRCPMLIKGHSKALGPDDDKFWYSLDGNGKMSAVDEPNKKAFMDWPMDHRQQWMNQKSAGDQTLDEVFFSTEPYKGELTADKLELQPQQEFKGEKCDVVVATRALRGGSGTSVVTWYIGTSDHLPRKKEQKVAMGNEPIVMIYDLWNVKASPGLKAVDVRLDPPKDIADEVFKPEDHPAPPLPNQDPAPQPPAQPVPAPSLGVDAGNVPPDFSLKTADGKTVTPADLKGKVTVLAFLWSKNTPSGKAVPILNEIKEAHKDVQIYAVMPREKSDDDAKKFLADNKASFQALLGGKEEDLKRSYKLSGYPGFYVIGADGKIVGFKQNSNVDTIKTEVTGLVNQATGGSSAAAPPGSGK